MLFQLAFLFFGFLLSSAHAKSTPIPETRQERFFRYPTTVTKIVPKFITSLVPSSCVSVDASLPPCKNMSIMRYEQDHESNNLTSSVDATPMGWGEYLALYPSTVTMIVNKLVTTTVQDSGNVVTFFVNGCYPSKLPMDINLCPAKETVQPTATYLSTLATSTLINHSLDITDLGSKKNSTLGSNFEFGEEQVEPSQDEYKHETNSDNERTQPLNIKNQVN